MIAGTVAEIRRYPVDSMHRLNVLVTIDVGGDGDGEISVGTTHVRDRDVVG